jgi:hypothetical protein
LLQSATPFQESFHGWLAVANSKASAVSSFTKSAIKNSYQSKLLSNNSKAPLRQHLLQLAASFEKTPVRFGTTKHRLLLLRRGALETESPLFCRRCEAIPSSLDRVKYLHFARAPLKYRAVITIVSPEYILSIAWLLPRHQSKSWGRILGPGNRVQRSEQIAGQFGVSMRKVY